MVTSTEADGTVVLSYDGAPWPKALFSLTAAAVVTMIYDLTIGARGTDRLAGLVGAAVTCGLGGVVVTQSARVRIRPWTRTVEWHRMWAFRHTSGAVRFDEIVAVMAEQSSNMSIHEAPHRRVVLRTRDGRSIPFTAGYISDAGGAILDLTGRVRELVGLAGPTSPA